MYIQKLDDGTLLVPRRAEGEGVVGTGMVEVKPTNEKYAEYLAAYEREQGLPGR